MAAGSPKFSLMLCVKNGMPYLREAVRSLAAQTYRDFEVVVQDGGSTDGSLAFLEQAEGLPEVRIESAPDRGLGQGFNRALRRSRGELIGSLDSDNLFDPQALEIVAALFAARPDTAVLYTAQKIIDEQGKVTDVFIPEPFDIERVMKCALVPPFGTSFFSRRVCGDALWFDERIQTADFDLWLRLSHLPIRMAPVIAGSTRRSSKSMSCGAERYDQFCAEKIATLERHLERDGHAAEALRRECIAGVYCWGAESVLRLEGPSQRAQRFLRLAAEMDPGCERLQALQTRTRAALLSEHPAHASFPCGAFPSPAAAYWNQRFAVAASSARLNKLRMAVDEPAALSPPQWAQWFAYAREYRPDLVIEVGRQGGSATAVLAEALDQNRHGQLVSLCSSTRWQQHSLPKLRPLVARSWLERVDARVGDVCQADFLEIVGGARRVLVVWDAPGFGVAEAVLGRLIPRLQDREHVVILHDVSDRRYGGSPASYGEAGLWRGTDWVMREGRYDCRLYLGWVDTLMEHVISVLDFLARNGAELQSGDHSFQQEIGANPERRAEMEGLLSPQDWSLLGHWAYFSLNSAPKPYTFPRV